MEISTIKIVSLRSRKHVYDLCSFWTLQFCSSIWDENANRYSITCKLSHVFPEISRSNFLLSYAAEYFKETGQKFVFLKVKIFELKERKYISILLKNYTLFVCIVTRTLLYKQLMQKYFWKILLVLSFYNWDICSFEYTICREGSKQDWWHPLTSVCTLWETVYCGVGRSCIIQVSFCQESPTDSFPAIVLHFLPK